MFVLQFGLQIFSSRTSLGAVDSGLVQKFSLFVRRIASAWGIPVILILI